jgi:hypothetical protein
MTKYYLRIEGVNLNNFVDETQDLSTIRGGSLLLLQAVKDAQSTYSGLTEISTGASVGFFSFTAGGDDEAGQLRDDVDGFLNKDNYRHATFVVDVTRESGTNSFPKDRERVLALNRWRQMAAPQIAVPSYSDTALSECDLDGIRPATVKDKKFKDTLNNVSASVAARREYGFSKKQSFVRDELNHINKGATVKTSFAWHFDQITKDGSRGNLDRKMAVIFFDGNGFGRIQSGLEDSKALTAFDVGIKTYRREWLASLVERMNAEEGWIVHVDDEATKDEDKKPHYRFEVLLWGGDEACIVVPAWKGWRVLMDFFAASAGWTNPVASGEKLKHAVGIVFCHHNAPIRRIKELAKRLCERAKERSRDESYVLYEILESFDNIGKSLDTHLITRCPKTNGAKVLTSKQWIEESLILDGERLNATDFAIMPRLKETLPRRKLVKFAQSLLAECPSLAIDTGALRDLLTACGGLAEADRSNLKKLIAGFGADADRWLTLIQHPGVEDLAEQCDDANPVWWLHINALWDYMV